jgi:hypothetical protein
MSVFNSLRKGFGFLLMSFGISRPAARPRPVVKPAPDTSRKPGNGQPS